ncbi:MAG: undecaprenyl-diphosphate phosphatase [Magnetococcales bacterium]|nr:undecaprenyl-diphosphate phosphatase [Magnetococcales bacterium]
MEWLHAVFLGLIQGITEFLPISSSGHLIILPYQLGWQDQGLIFDVAVNSGTLVALLIYFRRDVKDLFIGFVRSLRPGGLENNQSGYLAWSVALATIPIGVSGLLVKDKVEEFARDPSIVAYASIVFGVFLWLADRGANSGKNLSRLTWRDGILIGIGQIFALIPGASRSGVTMTAGLFLGFDRETSARLSFLMALPVGILVGGLEFIELIKSNPSTQELGFVAVGFFVAMFSALMIIKWLLTWVKSRNMTVFVVYRVLLGIIILLIIP